MEFRTIKLPNGKVIKSDEINSKEFSNRYTSQEKQIVEVLFGNNGKNNIRKAN